VGRWQGRQLCQRGLTEGPGAVKMKISCSIIIIFTDLKPLLVVASIENIFETGFQWD
jgi:hypothetical protein